MILLVAVGLLSTAATGSPTAALATVLGSFAWLAGTGRSRYATTTSVRRLLAAYSSRRCHRGSIPQGAGVSPPFTPEPDLVAAEPLEGTVSSRVFPPKGDEDIAIKGIPIAA